MEPIYAFLLAMNTGNIGWLMHLSHFHILVKRQSLTKLFEIRDRLKAHKKKKNKFNQLALKDIPTSANLLNNSIKKISIEIKRNKLL